MGYILLGGSGGGVIGEWRGNGTLTSRTAILLLSAIISDLKVMGIYRKDYE